MIPILIDGIAYGMLLFVLASGLAVTLGLMNFINLAHGAFAMAGGYVTSVLMNSHGVPFLVTLPVAFVVPALVGAVLERTLYAPLYGRSHLDHVLFSIGLTFMAVSATTWAMGSQQQLISLPGWLEGRFELFGIAIGRYRAFLIVVCAALVVALQLVLTRTRFGSRLRAAVDDRRVARGLGIRVETIFAATFAVGSGLGGLGGALGVPMLGLDPTFPLKYMVYFLIVVTIGGTAGLAGPFLAALIIGVADVAGKYYLPELGSFLITLLMIVLLVLRPQGLIARAR